MKITNILCGLACATLLAVSPGAAAQSVTLTGVSHSGSQGMVNGRISLSGKSVKSVKTYVYNMASGGSYVTADAAYTLDGDNISAPVAFADGDYAYRLEVTFSDNTKVVSPCIDPERTYAFMWLSDYQWQSGSADGDAGGCAPRYDRCTEDVCNRNVFGGITYVKQASTHANGHIQWAFPADHIFTRFVCRYGMEDDGGSYADAVYRFSANGSVVKEQRVYGRTNGSRGSNPWIYDLDMPMTGVTTLRWDAIGGANIWSDHCHLLMPRLYLDLREQAQVTFATPGGSLPGGTDRVTLSATSSSGAPVSYSVVEGASLARIEDGNILVANRGARGTVTVKASCPATDAFLQGSATLSFDLNLDLWASYLGARATTDGRTAFFSVNSRVWTLSELVCELYDNELSLNKVGEVDLLPAYASNGRDAEGFVSVALPDAAWGLCRIRYKVEGDEQPSYSPFSDGQRDIAYASDMLYVLQRGAPESVKADATVSGCNGGRLRVRDQEYGKGLSVTNNFHVDLGQLNFSHDFVRFRAEFGEQYGSARSISTGSGQYYMPLIVEECGDNVWIREVNYSYDAVNPNQRMNIDFTIEPGRYVNFRADGSSSVNGREYTIGAARYYTADYASVRRPQTIEWVESKDFKAYKPFMVELDAVASSGAPVYYHVVSGGEYASVSDGRLVFHTIPATNCTVVVEAVQAGSRDFSAAAPRRCSFNVLRAVTVAADEVCRLQSGNSVEEVVIYGNNRSVGQLTVEGGMLRVKKLVLKYTFIPGEWNYLAFPSDINLDRVADFAAKGYTLGAPEGSPSLTVARYNTLMGASNNTGEAWVTLKRPYLEAGRGYVMRLGTEAGTDPVEITFEIDNVRLDMETSLRPLRVDLDLSAVVPGETTRVYLKGENVKTNTLQVDVTYNPADHSAMPLNHRAALRDMRLTTDEAFTAMRLTLPTRDVARVGIFCGDRLVKAVKYVAPGVIDISSLAPGEYTVVVSYGPATASRTFTVSR